MAETATRIRTSTKVLFVVGALMLALVVGAALFADFLAVHPPDRSSGRPYESPSSEHLLGTDDLGRDLWAQLVFGARVSLWVGIIAAVAATVLGTAVALLAGWHGGWVDAVTMRIVDLTLSLPFLVLVLVLAAYFGRGLDVLILLIAGVLWARPARLLRGQVLKIREYGHTEAAHAMGARSKRIMLVHILWRLAPLLMSQFVRAAAVAVIVQSGVAFLGLGDPGRTSWGSTLYFANNGSAILTDAWLWWIAPPGVALAVLIVGLGFVGFTLEEMADPQLGGHGWKPPARRRLAETSPAVCPPGVRLDIRCLDVEFNGARVVREVDLSLSHGRVLGLVGESGSGKSTLGLAVPGLVPHPGRISADAVMLADVDLRRLGRRGLEQIRGRDIALVPQAAMSVLDPTMSVIRQVAESAALRSEYSGTDSGTPGSASRRVTTDGSRMGPEAGWTPGSASSQVTGGGGRSVFTGLSTGKALELASDLLGEVGLPVEQHRAFPHQLSGGQRQRVVIAMAVANRPRLLIADEPTTGLDVVTQEVILDLLDGLRQRLGFDLWLISHDLPLVASRADDLIVLYGGRVVESGPAQQVVSRPRHPYTAMLLAAFPSLRADMPDLKPVAGEVPDPRDLPAGCAFAPRCPHRHGDCDSVVPALRSVAGVKVACHHAPVEALPGEFAHPTAPAAGSSDLATGEQGTVGLPAEGESAECESAECESTASDAQAAAGLPTEGGTTDKDGMIAAGLPVEGGLAAVSGQAADRVAAPVSSVGAGLALRLDDVRVVYHRRHRGSPDVTALDGVSLDVGVGESVAIIGRSAAGKSTMAKLVLGLLRPVSGSVELLGQATADVSRSQMRRLRRRVQMVFQDPYQSLHPGMTVAGLVSEPLAIAGIGRSERGARVAEALQQLGLVPVEGFLDRHASTLSGGQRQRVALARTLVAEPELIVADEPASMLDASLRATVAAHLLTVRQALGATLVFITHDISLARLVAERIVVLSDGRVVEDGPTEQLLAAPAHDETRVIMDAAFRSQVRCQAA